MIIFADCRDPIFNSRDPNRVPKTPLKKPWLYNYMVFVYTIFVSKLQVKNPVLLKLASKSKTPWAHAFHKVWSTLRFIELHTHFQHLLTFVYKHVKQTDCFSLQLLNSKLEVFLYAFGESIEWGLLWSFCNNSNLHRSILKHVVSTIELSKESIGTFFIYQREIDRRQWRI